MKIGDKVKIIRMNDNGGKDWQASRLNGTIGIIDYIDSIGQVHLREQGLALIPGVDDFIIIEEAE